MTIVLRGLRKRYGERAVLDIPHLEVAAGQFVLVAGPNGAGKSTLLRSIAGIGAYEGTVERPRGPVGYLPQGDGVPAGATVAELLGLFRVNAVPDGWLPFARDLRIAQLSGGERQRVALACALSVNAALYVLDEPFADLDGGAADALLVVLTARRDDGATVIVSAPDRDVARIALAADRTVRLANGALVAPAELTAA